MLYKVKYYNYNKMYSKIFDTLGDAINFCVYTVHSGDVYGIDKIKD